MVIHQIQSNEFKGKQPHAIVIFCTDHWRSLFNGDFSRYLNVMNIKTRIWNHAHNCYFVTSYHFNPNKW